MPACRSSRRGSFGAAASPFLGRPRLRGAAAGVSGVLALKHSPLLGDFAELVVGEKRRRFASILPLRLFDEYLEGCRERDHEMPEWNEATRKRLRSSVYQILAQAGVIDNTKSLKLQPVFFSDQVLSYLESEREYYVLRCVAACQ